MASKKLMTEIDQTAIVDMLKIQGAVISDSFINTSKQSVYVNFEKLPKFLYCPPYKIDCADLREKSQVVVFTH